MNKDAENDLYELQNDTPKRNERNAGRKDKLRLTIKQLAFYSLRDNGWKRSDIMKNLSMSHSSFTVFNARYNSDRHLFRKMGIQPISVRSPKDYHNGYEIELESAKALVEADSRQAIFTDQERKELSERLKRLERAAAFQDVDEYRTFDTGIYTDIVKGYLLKALDDITENKATKEMITETTKYMIIEKVSILMEEVPSKLAEAYYNRKEKESQG